MHWRAHAVVTSVVSSSNLERILKDVAKIQSIVNSGRKRDKLRATVLAGSYKADLKKCYDQLEWAIKEFDVSGHASEYQSWR